MENELIEFYKSDIKPVDIGALYGANFPIYPGEVVILQAPPASMKTMLLQNWMVALKRPTYFIEMEMSARQIWSRFVMIENNWSEKQLAEHYKSLKNGMDQRFKWLTVDYSSPFPFEIEKRIQMLPKKPEIVVVDHLGLLRSKHKDLNMKLEEASQGLMELAVKHKIIVFAVSEINKTAFKEGMDISSSRGSFRIAYNANKLLSLKPYRDQDGSINYLGLKSDKNREREHINIKLMIDNVNIVSCKEE
jgi:replicative DNA helicase